MSTPKPWPAEGLERVGTCPVCGTPDRTLLHEGLVDKIFFCAPGAWTLWRCAGCRSAYLDPRPTKATIGLAYQTYYTHSAPPVTNADRGLARVRRELSNGYKNWRFGTRLEPASRWGVVASLLMPQARARFDREYRHLPRPGAGVRVLDVGFGDGTFLRNAMQMGWQAVGIDTDPEVVANARRSGLDVAQQDLDALDQPEGSFDVITVAHVIEHVHDPRALVDRCMALLKPGGRLWVETPNIDSVGHERFGADWRGLETPRHLVIFNGRSLRQLLLDAGFENVRDLPQASPVHAMYTMSERMVRGVSPYEETAVSPRLRLEMLWARLREAVAPSRQEFLAMVARKPSGPGR